MPPATPEELQALDALRALQGRPPLAAHEVEALTYEEPAPRAGPTALPAPSGEEKQALSYLREVAGPRPAASGIRLPDPGRIVGAVLDRVRSVVGASTQGEAQDMTETQALAFLRDAAGPAPAEHAGPDVPAPAAADPVRLDTLTDEQDQHLARLNRTRREAGRAPLSDAEATAALAELRGRHAA